jgi:hypothetical protein
VMHDNDLDFENATKADPKWNTSSSASICSLSRQHYLPFQCLGPSRAIGPHDEHLGIIRILPGRRNPVSRGEGEPVGDESFKLSLYECESASDNDVIERGKCTIFPWASTLSTSMTE